MREYLSALAALVLLFACTPEENGSGDNQPVGGGNGGDKIVHVTGISLDSNSATIKEGESIVLVATVTPDNADNKSVSWSSSSDAVATVDAGGKVIGIKAGSATITATTKDGDKTATCTITVEQKSAPTVHVTGIELDRTSATIKEGESITLVATVSPDNADNKSVSWSSSSDAVATVDAGGKVTGIKAGSATITATVADGGMKASCALSVEANLAPSVTVEAKNVSAISAVLEGKANLGSTVASDLKVGFQYSKSAGILPSNSTTIEAQDADASYNYTTPVTGLEPATRYYFRSFVRQNGQDTYGETKEFTTKDVASMLETKDASGVEATKATMNAKLDLADVLYKSLAYGFLWGTSESALNTDFKCTEISDNAISAALTNLSHKTQYWYRAYVTLDSQTFNGEVKSFTTVGYSAVAGEAVDLGLSVKWSSMNLGATSPSEYGDYFAWGETEPEDSYNYSWSTYELCNGSSSTLTKYNNNSSYGAVDNKSEFKDYGYEDDAARQALGGSWRIPTDTEWTELRTKCTWTSTTNYNGTRVLGRIVTASNGNSIFLPAAGYWGGTIRYGAGSYGYYWSSSLSTDYPYSVWYVYFNYDNVNRSEYFRYFGRSVRPVSE